MKKILFVLAMVLMSVCSFGQTQRTTNDGMTYSTFHISNLQGLLF